jgi:hypothetical protein
LKQHIPVLNWIWSKKKQPQLPMFWSVTAAAKKLGHIFNALTGLETFHLHYDTQVDDLSSISRSLPLVHSTWAAIGPNLRDLFLSAPLETLGHSLLPSPTFLRLESLSITFHFSGLYGGAEDRTEILRNILAPFINRHHPTIQSLELIDVGTYHGQQYPYHGYVAASLLLHLTHFPRLTKFTLRDNSSRLTQSESPGLRYVLQLHPQLLELKLLGYDPIDLDDRELTLPKLRSLNLGLYCMAYSGLGLLGIAGIKMLLSNIPHSLTTLKLDEYRLNSIEVYKIIHIIAGLEMLHTLSLKLKFLSPHILDYSAVQLPELKELRFSGISYADADPENFRDPSQMNAKTVRGRAIYLFGRD